MWCDICEYILWNTKISDIIDHLHFTINEHRIFRAQSLNRSMNDSRDTKLIRWILQRLRLCRHTRQDKVQKIRNYFLILKSRKTIFSSPLSNSEKCTPNITMTSKNLNFLFEVFLSMHINYLSCWDRYCRTNHWLSSKGLVGQFSNWSLNYLY